MNIIVTARKTAVSFTAVFFTGREVLTGAFFAGVAALAGAAFLTGAFLGAALEADALTVAAFGALFAAGAALVRVVCVVVFALAPVFLGAPGGVAACFTA